MSSRKFSELGDEVGVDRIDLLRLVEADRQRHEEAINEHHRTSLAIRGFALTAVAALIAASYASFVPLPGYLAVLVASLFLFADYYYSQLYVSVERRVPVLDSLGAEYRRLLARSRRSERDLRKLRGDIRAYVSGPVVPDKRPMLWPPNRGRLWVFVPLYLLLIAASLASARYIDTHEKPGTALETQVVCIEPLPGLSAIPSAPLSGFRFRACPPLEPVVLAP